MTDKTQSDTAKGLVDVLLDNAGDTVANLIKNAEDDIRQIVLDNSIAASEEDKTDKTKITISFIVSTVSPIIKTTLSVSRSALTKEAQLLGPDA